MKLRTTHNSIRIRIRKSELSTLEQEHQVIERIQFPNQIVFKFALVMSKDQSNLHADLADNNLTISIPEAAAINWINTNEVGLEAHLELADNEQLHLLIEKDFPCLDRPNEDKSDTFWELSSEKPDAC